MEIQGRDPREINKYSNEIPTQMQAIVCTRVSFSFKKITASIIVTIGLR